MVERPSNFFIKKVKIKINPKTDKILAIRLEGLFWVENKVGCSFFLWTLGLAFNDFTLCPAEGSNSYRFPDTFNPLL
jgi:hypothetical protein